MGTILSADDVKFMRSWVENNLMPDTCTILSRTLSNDGMGGGTVTWGTATAGVVCRLDRVNQPTPAVAGAALQSFQSWVMTMPYDETITTQNRILHDGHTYNVTGIDDDKSWPVTIRVYLELVKP